MAHMANCVFVLLVSLCLFNVITLPWFTNAVSSCDGPCQTLNDCSGQLICINGKCNDDPDLGTHECSGSGGGGGGGGSNPSPNNGNCQSNGPNSPPFNPSGTQAILTVNNFGEGGDGGGPSECDEQYHPYPERVVALSTGWYSGGSRCGQMIKITARNGNTATAKVVDECDSEHGCDSEHAGQPPCRTNIVDGSKSVWEDLKLDTDVGEEQVTWTMA